MEYSRGILGLNYVTVNNGIKCESESQSNILHVHAICEIQYDVTHT